MLCTSKFDDLLTLDEHIERVHTGNIGLRSLPAAVRVDGSGIQLIQEPADVRPAAAAGAGAVPATTTTAIMECGSRKSHLLLTTLLKDKANIVKTERTDSLEQVEDKWSLLADKLSTDYGVFDSNGVVKNDHWGGVVRLSLIHI